MSGEESERVEAAIALDPTPERLASAMRLGVCPDDELFDAFLPHALKTVSGRYWTPLVVAMRVATWLNELEIRSLVDIGSGAGKFCVAVALASECRVTGIEQRGRLVVAARALARKFSVDERVRFVEGALEFASVPSADAYYLFNPFGENRFAPGEHLDEDVELGDARFSRDVAAVEAHFAAAPRSTCVVTYNGFGGKLPATYEQIRTDREMPHMLRMFRKRA